MAAWIIIAVALIVVGLVAGTTLNFAAPFLAIPIVIALGIVWYFYAVVRRSRQATSMRERREDAAPGTEFTDRDRETLV